MENRLIHRIPANRPSHDSHGRGVLPESAKQTPDKPKGPDASPPPQADTIRRHTRDDIGRAGDFRLN